jgi:hypothetical protein
MTICIGALAKKAITSTPCIVLCFDSKVANENFGSETEHKFHILADRVMALAADRPGRAKELAIIYRDVLAGVQLTESNLLNVLREPIQILKRKLGSAYIGRKLGLAYQEFLDRGVAQFGQVAFDKYCSDIENNPIGVDMIIAGFLDNDPFLVELRNGDVERVTNFSLIGTGAYTAEPALHARAQTPNTLVADAVYNVYEAKKMAESSSYVGQETRMYVLDALTGTAKLRISVLNQDGEKLLRGRFKKYGPRPRRMPLLPLPDTAFIGGIY